MHDCNQPARPAAAPYLIDVHSFRALAIIFIVAGHSIPLFNWGFRHSLVGWPESLMTNGTVFFVFIAGFLFQHLSARFQYREYLRKKCRNVLLPYLFFSAPIIIGQILTHSELFTSASNARSIAAGIVRSLITGCHIEGAYWFIPMIGLFYLLAPAFAWMDRDRRVYRLLPILIVVPVLVHRPSNLEDIWHSCAYFLPVYIYGMWFSRNRDAALAWHKRAMPLLLVAIAATTWLEVVYFKRPGAIDSVAMFSTEQGILGTNAVQKLLLCGVLLVLLRQCGSAVHRVLGFVGDLSFGVYFLHMLVINAYSFTGIRTPRGNLLVYGGSVLATLLICIGCLAAAKSLTGARSRALIGC